MLMLWLLIVAVVLLGGYTYLSRRLIRPSHLPRQWKRAVRLALAALFLIPVLTSILQRSGFEQLFEPLVWIAYTGLGLISSVFTFLLLRDSAWVLLRLGKRLSSKFRRASIPAAEAPTDEKRRLLLVNAMNAGLLAGAATMTAYGVYEARRRPGIVEVDVRLKDLPDGLAGFRIVQISDIHAGLTVRQDFVETIAEIVHGLDGDMIALTGDLADGNVRQLRADVAPLGQLRAPGGKFFVTGNHEYYSGHQQWVEEADRLGYRVLLNEHALVERNGARLLVAGVTDVSGGRFAPEHESDPGRAVAGAPAADARILLAHQPRSVYDALPYGFDLQISGHTHGGQFFPWNLLAPIGQPYLSGLHNHHGTWVYVSRGTGYWGPPVRIAARSEITVLRLIRA
jgi:uncharacterized protein